MKFLLDTNVWIATLNNSPTVVAERVLQTPAADIALCDVVKAELIYGAFKSDRQSANLARLRALFASFSSLPFDEQAAWQCGEIHAALRAAGKPVGAFDMQIAAIAKARGLVLVTANAREFGQIAGLRMEDWSVATSP